MEFIAFTQTQRAVEFLSTVHCKNSTLTDVTPQFVAKHVNKGLAAFAKVAESPRAFRCPHTPAWMEFKDVCDSMFADVWAQKAPAATLLATAQTRSQGVLDEAAAAAKRRGRA
jgi:hypothetical protein